MTIKTQIEKLHEIRVMLEGKPYFYLTYPGLFVLYRRGETNSLRASLVARCNTVDKLHAKVKHMTKEVKK